MLATVKKSSVQSEVRQTEGAVVTSPSGSTDVERARQIVGWYTLAAAGTGAVPVPASSIAIVANNGFMMAHVAAVMKSPVGWWTVVNSLGIAGTLNVLGRAVFIEGAKGLAWGTGSLWALFGLSALGATTAGLQTFIIGPLAIEIARNGGQAIDQATAAALVAAAKQNYDSFLSEMKAKKLSDPGLPPKAELEHLDRSPPT